MIFEKIRERLQDALSNVNVNRITDNIIKDKPKELGQIMAYNRALDIINQVEAEYNNGWIPCSERLPNEADYYLVTKEDDIAYSIDIALWDDYHWSNNGFHKADKVIACQPLHETYVTKGK